MAALNLREKLAILADAAEYDASCASSGTSKRSLGGGRSVLDRAVRQLAERGQPIAGNGETILLTIHPSYLLRMRDEQRKREKYAAFVRDQRRAAELAK